MATIYRKTEKGRQEVDTRVHRLAPRLRAALILVDGQRSLAELAKLVPPKVDVFETLLAEGFIEPVASKARPAPEDIDKTQPLPVLRDSVALRAADAAPPVAQVAAPTNAVLTPLAWAAAAAAAAAGAAGKRHAQEPGAKVSDLARRRAQAVATLTAAVGAKSRSLAGRIEQANDEMKLRPLLVQARNLIASSKGQEAADAFVARFLL